MGTLNNQEINKTRSDTFPVNEVVNIVSATSLTMFCNKSSGNAVTYTFSSSGDTGSLDPGESVEFLANSDPITDTITITFTAPANVEISSSIGVGSGGGGGTSFDNPTHQQVINPAALVVSGWNKLSFVCSGAITVTLDGNAIVYPQTLGRSEVLGETVEATGVTANAITFNGTGTLLLTIKE